MEDEDDEYALNFWLEQGQLQQQRVARTESQTYLRKYLKTRYPSLP
jgi:hypothetical protein